MNEADVNIKARRITDTILEAHRANVAPLRELISGKIEALLLEASRALSSPDTKEGQGECIRCEITAGEYPDRISVKPPAGTFERGFVKMGASVDLIFQPVAPAPEPEGEEPPTADGYLALVDRHLRELKDFSARRDAAMREEPSHA
jgi:hypothetical protein